MCFSQSHGNVNVTRSSHFAGTDVLLAPKDRSSLPTNDRLLLPMISQNATWIAPLHTPTSPTTGYRISCTSSIQPKIFHNL
ncbi:hypothetical protein DPMN_072326 [Dreissena polymorpha]|uniref:Uncharacterized protein n=1 Tax=Dreissena polymorpha TaxID=45954 RepID=A0A9D4BQD0_DREPO|nr:hypothetical protein DPMN_072326 [Dreissena polymorpha]